METISKKGFERMEEEGNFFKGIFIAFLLSIPLWMIFFGWITMISRLLKS
ncbi:hypothetical protein ACFQU5_04755 [Ureibacillus sp. GCM10028918]